MACNKYCIATEILPSSFSGIEAKNCTAAINVERNTEYRIKSGNPAVIKCPVTYCQNKPEIKWYKKNNHSYWTLHNGQGHTFTWADHDIFVLKFSSVHKNDSGLYHCESISGNQTDKGHYINIIIQGKPHMQSMS